MKKMQPKLGHHQTNAVNKIKQYSERFYKGYICYFNFFFPPLCFKMQCKPLIVITVYINKLLSHLIP